MMADRTSAGVFGEIFCILAEDPSDEHKKMARRIFELSRGYDFSPYQMGADAACQKLGLVRRGVDPRYPEDGTTHLWLGEPGYEDAVPQPPQGEERG